MRSERPGTIYLISYSMFFVFFSFCNFVCIHVCVFLMIWPGQFERPVMYYDDFFVAKSNWDARKSSFETR